MAKGKFLRLRRMKKATPKVKKKTNSAIAKRIKVLANGNIKITQSNKRHNMGQKSQRQLIAHRGMDMLDKTLHKKARYGINSKIIKRKNPKQENIKKIILQKKISKLVNN